MDSLFNSKNKGELISVIFLVIPTNGFCGFPYNQITFSLSIFEKESINDLKTKIQWHFPEEFKNVPFNIRAFDPETRTYRDLNLHDKVFVYFNGKSFSKYVDIVVESIN
ncbi:hypothetical protein Glove_26g323 [Diversispora epigaea]|uniref:Uncharacterized protein n=1 Tax=Diversispora epigaea TaxID=1348612 RepID=A0A397JIJ0_9GLOM|nr:hypothetical protein Glove_26g323 [Diversispora epigaea]